MYLIFLSPPLPYHYPGGVSHRSGSIRPTGTHSARTLSTSTSVNPMNADVTTTLLGDRRTESPILLLVNIYTLSQRPLHSSSSPS